MITDLTAVVESDAELFFQVNLFPTTPCLSLWRMKVKISGYNWWKEDVTK